MDIEEMTDRCGVFAAVETAHHGGTRCESIFAGRLSQGVFDPLDEGRAFGFRRLGNVVVIGRHVAFSNTLKMLIPFEGVINQSFDGRGIGLEIQFGLGLRRLMAVHAVTLNEL